MHTKNIYREKALDTANTKLTFSKPILVIEDQYSIASFTKAKFQERWDCDVVLCHDYKTAKTLVHENKSDFQIAICDLHLPDAPSGEVVDLLIDANIPTLVLTASFNEKLRTTVLEKGVVDYILKSSSNTYDYLSRVIERLEKNKRSQILLVDDSPNALAHLEHMLKPLQFQIFTAQNGVEALRILDEQPAINMILTDYRMPVMDGFELTLNARKKRGHGQLSIIGLSASENRTVSAQFLKHGANDYLNKPFIYEELFCRVHQNLNMLDQMDAILTIAYIDYLTGLYNRRFFFEKGQDLFEQSQAKQQNLAMAVMDIDHFKKINDNFGHDVGDTVLKAVASLLKQDFDNSALLGRIGGEEFALLFNFADVRDINNRLELFRQKVMALEVRENNTVIKTTISIGLTAIHANNIDDLLKQGDKNLYQAKAEGRNCIVCL